MSLKHVAKINECQKPSCGIFSSDFRSNQCLPKCLTELMVAFSAVAVFFGCTPLSKLDNTDDKAIYSYDYKDAKTQNTVHEAGLLTRRLIDAPSFTVQLPQISLVPAGRGVKDLDGAYGRDTRCVVNDLTIEAGSKRGEYFVQAELRSPLAYLDSEKATAAEHIESWIQHCDCLKGDAEFAGSCFGRRFAAEALRKLREVDSQPDAELSREMLDRIVRAVGRPFVAYDRLLIAERGLALPGRSRSQPYLMQRMSPGEDLCFHTSSYSTTWLPGIDAMGSIAEPAADACFPWEAVTRANYRNDTDAKGEVAVGVDPLGRVGPDWNELQGELLVGQKQIQNAEVRNRLMTSVDQISGRPDTPFRYATLFTSNHFYLIPNGPERDMEITSVAGLIYRQQASKAADASWFACELKGKTLACNELPDAALELGKDNKKVSKKIDIAGLNTGLPRTATRGSFIVLARDARLSDYIRHRVATPNDTCGNASMASSEKIHRYLKCLTTNWGKSQGITITDTEVSSWMLDITYPSNVRPFVRLQIAVDGFPERVRVGSTLLNVIDRRLGLSAQVFDLRQQMKDPQAAETPSEIESRLIETVTQQVEYERRSGLGFQRIDLRRAQRLEDLLVPLTSGDRVKWR